MKKYVVKFSFWGAALYLLSCSNNNTGTTNSAATNSTDSAVHAAIDKTKEDTTAAASHDFILTAARKGLGEVAMAKLAQTNGGSKAVKEYGKMLEKDYSISNKKLLAIATAENITLPATVTDEQTTNITRLQNLKGNNFDKEFIPVVIENHTQDMVEFKKIIEGNNSQKVKDFAADMLPMLQTHLDKAKALHAAVK